MKGAAEGVLHLLRSHVLLLRLLHHHGLLLVHHRLLFARTQADNQHRQS